MELIGSTTLQVFRHPGDFAMLVLKGFAKNQGLLLAGAIAYYALLSVLPLLILSVIILSHLVDQDQIFQTLGRYLEWLVPSQSAAVLADVSGFLNNRVAIGMVLVASMLFFSAIAFGVVEKAMAVIFAHRRITGPRNVLVAAVLPYCFVVSLGIVLLGVTFVSIALQAMAEEHLHMLGSNWSLRSMAGGLLYLLGLCMEAIFLTVLYLVMPGGRTRFTHALIGGLAVTIMWELVRHVLVWYFTTLSSTSVVYGSLTTAVVALFSLEIVATLLLLGAQSIAEFEQLETSSSICRLNPARDNFQKNR